MSPYRDDGSNQIWPGLLDAVPPEFADCLHEPAFKIGDTTFCVWRRREASAWQKGPIDFPADHVDPDGSGKLLPLLDGDPETYRAWAQDYYEQHVELEAERRVYAHEPLDDGIIKSLDSAMTLVGLRADIEEIGYPPGDAMP